MRYILFVTFLIGITYSQNDSFNPEDYRNRVVNAIKSFQTFRRAKVEDIPQAPYIKIGIMLHQIEIDPAESFRFCFNDNMIVANITMA